VLVGTLSSNFARLAHELGYARAAGCLDGRRLLPTVTLDELWHDPH